MATIKKLEAQKPDFSIFSLTKIIAKMKDKGIDFVNSYNRINFMHRGIEWSTLEAKNIKAYKETLHEQYLLIKKDLDEKYKRKVAEEKVITSARSKNGCS